MFFNDHSYINLVSLDIGHRLEVPVKENVAKSDGKMEQRIDSRRLDMRCFRGGSDQPQVKRVSLRHTIVRLVRSDRFIFQRSSLNDSCLYKQPQQHSKPNKAHKPQAASHKQLEMICCYSKRRKYIETFMIPISRKTKKEIYEISYMQLCMCLYIHIPILRRKNIKNSIIWPKDS